MTDSGTTDVSSSTSERAVTAASSWVIAARSGLITALDWTKESITPIGWQSLILLGIGVPVGIIWK